MSLPLTFQMNQGQTDPSVKYLAHRPGWGLCLKSREVILTFQDQKEADQDSKSTPPAPLGIPEITIATVGMQFFGAKA